MEGPLKLGILLWSQAVSWPEIRDATRRIERLGYDYLWTWTTSTPSSATRTRRSSRAGRRSPGSPPRPTASGWA